MKEKYNILQSKGAMPLELVKFISVFFLVNSHMLNIYMNDNNTKYLNSNNARKNENGRKFKLLGANE
jgi:hypothetical protein